MPTVGGGGGAGAVWQSGNIPYSGAELASFQLPLRVMLILKSISTAFSAPA
jgi:hypothetical protein